MIPAALVAAWLAFASAHSGLPIPANVSPPTVLTMPLRRDYGLTFPRTHSVVIDSRLARRPFGQCVLAHELTHWLQSYDGVSGPAKVVEPPAFRVDADCFDEIGMHEQADLDRQRADAIQAGGCYADETPRCHGRRV